MRRWPALLCVLAFASVLLGCSLGRTSGGNASIADLVLRVGEDVGTEVETFEGQLAPDLAAALNAGNPNAQEPISLPIPPGAKLRGSGRVSRPDGLIQYFVMYEVKTAEGVVGEAMQDLVDTTPWQAVGGQSNSGVFAVNFQNTRNPSVTGSVVVQPLPTSGSFEVVISRDGKEKKLTLNRRAFIPVLGAEFAERDGGLVVTRVVPGEASSAGMQENDRVVRVAGKEVRDGASLETALRSMSEGKDVLTSVIYIVRVAPDLPVRGVVSPPSARTLPKDFPAPFLVLNGAQPVAVRWSTGAGGGTYETTLLTRQSPGDVLRAYQQLLPQQRLNIARDTAQGSATMLEFANTEGSLSGTLTVDVFEEDDSYTAIAIQLRRGTTAAQTPGGAVPSAPPPGASPTATAPPAATSTPRATSTPAR